MYMYLLTPYIMKLTTKLLLYHSIQDMNIEIYNPRNTQAVELYFRGEKMAKVMGSLAAVKPSEDHKLSGVLVKRGFNYHLIDPSDLSSRFGKDCCDITDLNDQVDGCDCNLVQH